jgi:AcrR family transcriptional regulator
MNTGNVRPVVAAGKGQQAPAPRPYVSRVRSDAAVETRRRVLASARTLFQGQGYARTTMASVAAEAGVAVDTVYASVGRKPQLLRLLLETAISGGDEAVPAEQRDYVREIRAEPDAAAKLRIYAAAVAALMPRLAPVVRVCVEAGPSEPEIARIWQEISERRAANMRLLAGELAATGSLRSGLGVEEAGDVLWALNSPEMYELLVGQRGWSLARYESFLATSWQELLLAPPAPTAERA